MWPSPPTVVINPQERPRSIGEPRPVSAPSSESASVKPHGDAGADRGGEADEEGLPRVLRREGGGEDRRERRDRSVHQAGEPRLHVGQHELAMRDRVFLGARVSAEMLVLQPLAPFATCAALRRGEIAEELARLRVARALRGLQIEARASSSISPTSSRTRSMPRLPTSQ